MKMEYQVNMKWMVKRENLKFPRMEVRSQIVETTIPHVYYRLFLNCHDVFGFYLTCCIGKDSQPIEADLTLSIASANKKIPLNVFAAAVTKTVAPYRAVIGTIEEVMDKTKHYIVDGNITFVLSGVIKKQILKRKYPFHVTSLGSVLWKRNDDKNFKFVIGDKTIMVHKFVMAERSGYFKAMFDAAWKENEENQTAVTEFSEKVVEKAVKFCYDFPLAIENEDEGLSFLQFGDYYDIKTLKLEAENYLTEKISVENVCGIANGAVNSNSKILQLCCINFLVKCLKESTAVEGIDELDADFKSQLLNHAFCNTQKL